MSVSKAPPRCRRKPSFRELLTNTALDHGRLVSEACHRLAQFVPKFIEVCTTDSAEFDMLEIAPDAFDRIQIRCIRRQAFQLNVGCCTFGQKAFHLPIVNRRSIPDNQQFASQMLLEMLEEPHYIGTGQGPSAAAQIEATIARDRTNHRTMLACQRFGQNRRLADRSIAAYRRRQEIEARLVYEDQRALFGLGFFLSAGACVSRQASIAAGLR
jgi:hypothetical protein